MLMAEENTSSANLNFWQTDDIDEDFGGGGGDGTDDVWIDFDALNRILDEEVAVDQWEQKPPMMLLNTQEDLSRSNTYQNGKDPPELNQWTELASQNGVNESKDVLPIEDGLPETSEQCHSENMAPSDYRETMESDEMFEFPETSDWPTMSCFEHDNGITKEGEAGAVNVPLHSYSYNTTSFLPVPLPTHSSTFDFASRDPSGQTNIMNPIYLINEKSNKHGPVESSDPKCASHPTSVEESDLTLSIGNHRAGHENIPETQGLEQNHASTSELTFIDVNMPFPNFHPTENMENLASCMYYEDDISYTNHSSCERSSTITDASNFADPKKFMPQFDLPFLENREEKMTCKNGRVKIEAEALPLEQNASAIDFSNISDCLCTSPKYEASSHCSSGTSRDADGCSSSDSSWKLMPGSQVFMPIKKKNVKTEVDQGGKPRPSKCGSYQSLKAVDGYCSSLGVNPSGIEAWHFADQAQNQLNTDAQSLTSTKKLEVFVKDERKNEHILKRTTDYRSVRPNGVVQVNKSVYKSTIDDDADVCILEDISDPINVPLGRVHGESLITSQRPGSDPLYPIGMGGARLKSFDERITFRAALQDIYQPKSESTPPEGSLAVPLLRHQRIALAWMVQKETVSLHCSGGILADDQGLGKTISTIALILTEKPSSSKVSPVSAEQTEAKAFNLEDDDDGGVLQLNGVKRDPDCGQDIIRKGSIKNETVAKGRPAAGTLVVCPTSVLRQWADELQNKVSKELKLSVLVYHGSNRTKDPVELAKYDVVLTTYSIVSMEVPKQPLVDKEDDDKYQMGGHSPSMEFSCSKKRKYPPSADKKSRKNKKGADGALLDSVARPLARVGWFRVVLDEAQSIKNHRTQVARACWGLRAKRRWCLSGTPVQNAIDDLYSYFRFLRYEPYAVYKSFVSMIKLPISRNPATGYKKLQAVLRTIMLRRTKGTFLDGEPIINLPPKSVELKRVEFSLEEREFYSKLEADSRAQFKVYAEAGTVKQNYVNILLMLLRLRQACDHPLLVRGYDSNSVWKSSMETAKKLAREKQINLLNCLEACSEICCICNDPPEDAVVTICGHIFCNQCILEYLTGDENVCPASECKVHLTITSVFSRGTLRGSLSDASKPIEKEPSCSEQGPSDSSKIKTALKVLESLPPKTLDSKEASNMKAVSEKAIVFSQWTRMLDLLEAQLKTSCIQYRRLDGTMSVLARDKAVKDFNTLPEVTVMIMSLKAASLGLNMVAACHVILLDLWWNPTTEDQAIDRAHRIGQTRPVTVLRLTVKDTVEDRILALQQKKREMVASAFGEDETGTSKTRLTVDDLKYLFMA